MNRHPTDQVSLASGLIFLGVAGSWLLPRLTAPGIAEASFAWVVALGLVAVGVSGIVGVVRSTRRRQN